MGDEEQPAWLRNSASAPSPAAQKVASTSSPSRTAASGPEPRYKNVVKTTFLVFNMGFMVFLAAVGALGVGSANDINDTGVIFVGIYLCLFAAIEFLFEVSQICPVSRLDEFMKKNFGFLFGIIGKSLFELFMGALAFGLSKPRELALASGILVCAWAILQILVYLKWPQYFDLREKYQP